MEFNKDAIEMLIKYTESEIAKLSTHQFVQQPEALRKNNFENMNEALFVFLDKLIQNYQMIAARPLITDRTPAVLVSSD
jgi:GMP synthase (glutamine-hydrolysing)